MFNHEPEDYACPFCLLARGGEDKYNSQQDIIYRNKLVTAFVSPRWWPNNPGNVIIIPNEHFENIYDLPAQYTHQIQDMAREVAIAFKEVCQTYINVMAFPHVNITSQREGKRSGIITCMSFPGMKVTICTRVLRSGTLFHSKSGSSMLRD